MSPLHHPKSRRRGSPHKRCPPDAARCCTSCILALAAAPVRYRSTSCRNLGWCRPRGTHPSCTCCRHTHTYFLRRPLSCDKHSNLTTRMWPRLCDDRSHLAVTHPGRDTPSQSKYKAQWRLGSARATEPLCLSLEFTYLNNLNQFPTPEIPMLLQNN